ncbi:MAG: N-acetylglutaminylglutamine amidotransferase [Gammaproteobacteria bacterium]|nr:MAG: N-acetylglutaminylglutamine amidotransferase [Gammaproteobacteria bacterium]
MCAISGEIRFDGNKPNIGLVKKINQFQSFRGPDDNGVYCKNNLSFAHSRLSIIDLSDKSQQPMIDKIGQCVLVFNGAIYNFKILKKELEKAGFRFKSTGDTEVIIKSYLYWGEDCLQKFNGAFSFALYDLKKKIVFCARDRMGIKPFYYHKNSDYFRFASFLPALLLDKKIKTDMNPDALHFHFTLHGSVPAPHTIIKGIKKLAPASKMIIKFDGSTQITKYWELDSTNQHKNLSEEEYQQKITETLISAVKLRQQISDVPVAVLLSGGLDSSLIVALLVKNGITNLQTYSIGFDSVKGEIGDEFYYSKQVADMYGTDFKTFNVDNNQLLQRLPEVITKMAEPMSSADNSAFYLLSEQVAKNQKVVLSGQGADEVFGGYFWYQKMAQAKNSDNLQKFAPFYFDRNHQEYKTMITYKYQSNNGDISSKFIKNRLDNIRADEYINKVFNLDTTTLIVDDPVKRVDNMTMAWGLEARVPFLDHRLVELAAGMPSSYKLSQNGKGILKNIAKNILPKEVITRPKGYFPVPALKSIDGKLLEFMQDTINSKSCLERGLYKKNYLQNILKKPNENLTNINGNKLYQLTLLESWLQIHL